MHFFKGFFSPICNTNCSIILKWSRKWPKAFGTNVFFIKELSRYTTTTWKKSSINYYHTKKLHSRSVLEFGSCTVWTKMRKKLYFRDGHRMAYCLPQRLNIKINFSLNFFQTEQSGRRSLWSEEKISKNVDFRVEVTMKSFVHTLLFSIAVISVLSCV